MQQEEINIRSEEVNEILTSPPKWIFRWGITVIFTLIIIGLCLSNLIKYPDILRADITLTTLNPPIKLIAKINGRITHLLVHNNEFTKKGQVIAVIETIGNYKDVLYVDSISRRLMNQPILCDSVISMEIKENINVGELTPFYLIVLKSIKDLNLYNDINPYKRQIILLKKDLVSYNELSHKYKQQQVINNEGLNITEKDYNRDNELYKEGVISAREFDDKKKDYLNALNSNEQVKITFSNALIQINSIEKNILQLQIQDYQELTKLKNELQQNLKSLNAEINKWRKNYIIESPVDGKISFSSIWTVNQNIQTGDELFSIIPNQKQQFIGKCILPVANSGKLARGQKVNIKLDNYLYAENGILEGIVTNVSEVPNQGNYIIDVKLQKGLITSYNKTLTYKQEMKGKADIITKSISVMDRIFFNLKVLAER